MYFHKLVEWEEFKSTVALNYFFSYPGAYKTCH